MQLKNEMKYDDMIEVMLNLHKYVPSRNITKCATVNGSEHILEDKKMYPVLFGGDQLSVARYRGSKTIRRSSSNSVERLEGLFPVAEDWHTEVTVLKVSRMKAYTYIFNFYEVTHFSI